jgi:dTDP-4-amino-4,6-dideoxygalactose transaminase/SAM-dependent methyltransferase
MIPSTKAVLSYGAIFRSLLPYDWEGTWREHFTAHAVRAYPDARTGFRGILQTLRQAKPACNEIILPAYTHPSLISTIREADLEPRLIDMDIMAARMSVTELRKSVNSKTLAIMTTNLFGALDPIEEIWAICRETGVFLIEDISNVLGSYSSKIELGMFGDVAFFSLDTNSVITTMHGGIVCWRNPALAQDAAPGGKFRQISWKSLAQQLAYPIRMNRFVSGIFGIRSFSDPELISKRTDDKWSRQQARLSALLLPGIEKEAGYRRKICGNIKRDEAQLGRDLLRYEKYPRLTQYPCLAKSHEQRESILMRLERHGFAGTCGHDKLKGVIDVKQLPITAALISRLYTVPCHPGLSLSRLDSMLAQLDQSQDAVYVTVQRHYALLVAKHGEKPAANGYRRSIFRRCRRLIGFQLDKLPKDSLSVLDSGCGNGVMAPLFREHLKIGRLDGVDFVEDALQIANEQYKYTRTFQSNVMSLDTAVAGKKYDFINSSEVIPYVSPDNFPKFLQAHRNCLRDGGHLLLTFPNLQSVCRAASRGDSSLPFNFSPDDVIEAIAKSGFRAVSAVGSGAIGATRFNLSNNLSGGIKKKLSCEISVLCEAIGN